MSLQVYSPADAAAVALDADSVATALQAAAVRRGVDITITRTGSRGLHWLEPLLEVATSRG
ncbi:MAG: formate dehydrogenase, partial [Rhizobiales bacterium]|nr:formate dehydrogenase [Hyphomicrobiales bacterium]